MSFDPAAARAFWQYAAMAAPPAGIAGVVEFVEVVVEVLEDVLEDVLATAAFVLLVLVVVVEELLLLPQPATSAALAAAARKNEAVPRVISKPPVSIAWRWPSVVGGGVGKMGCRRESEAWAWAAPRGRARAKCLRGQVL